MFPNPTKLLLHGLFTVWLCVGLRPGGSLLPIAPAACPDPPTWGQAAIATPLRCARAPSPTGW